MVSYYHPVVTLSVKCTVFEMATYWSKIADKNEPHFHLSRSLGATPCEFFDVSYLDRNYTVSQKKTVQTYFLSELCQISTDCKNFWHQDSRENKLF